MINKPNNWAEVQDNSDRRKLPLGAYVCKIKQTGLVDTDYGQQLAILFDIEEGSFKGFYQDDFNSSTLSNKKWKGVLKVWLPRNDGSPNDEWTKSSLKGFINAVEKSNPGFIFNWDEKTLVNKYIGIIFRNEEWEYEGKSGWVVRPYRAITIEKIRNGEYTIPADKPLKRTPVFTDMGSDTSDLPFAAASNVNDAELPF